MVTFVMGLYRSAERQSLRNRWWWTSIVPQNGLPPPILVQWGSMRAHLKPLDALDPMSISVLIDDDLCQGAQVVLERFSKCTGNWWAFRLTSTIRWLPLERFLCLW